MKKQILTLIIGILIGAILATTVLLLTKNNKRGDMPDFDKTEMKEFKKGDKDSSDNENTETDKTNNDSETNNETTNE